jgi:hypothetical protein
MAFVGSLRAVTRIGGEAFEVAPYSVILFASVVQKVGCWRNLAARQSLLHPFAVCPTTVALEAMLV